MQWGQINTNWTDLGRMMTKLLFNAEWQMTVLVRGQSNTNITQD